MGPPTTSECLFRISFHMVGKSFPEWRAAVHIASRSVALSIIHLHSSIFCARWPIAAVGPKQPSSAAGSLAKAPRPSWASLGP